MGRQLNSTASTGVMMPLARFGDVPAVNDLPELSSPEMSRSPSTSSTCSSASLPSPVEPSSSPKPNRQSRYHQYESAYRGFQRENHDLRKLLTQLRQQLAFTQQHIEDEESKQHVLQQTVTDLQASLDEIRARSLDVLEENLTLRAENQNLRLAQTAKLPAKLNATQTQQTQQPLSPTKPDGDVSPLALSALPIHSPLDRQLAARHPDTMPKPAAQRRQRSRRQHCSSSTQELGSRRDAICAPSASFSDFLDMSSCAADGGDRWSLQPHHPQPTPRSRRQAAAAAPTDKDDDDDNSEPDDNYDSGPASYVASENEASRRARQGSSDTVRDAPSLTSKPSRTLATAQQIALR